MSYVSLVGKRYLYNGKIERQLAATSAIAALATGAGAAWISLHHGSLTSALAVFLLGATSIISGLLAVFTVFTGVSVLGVVIGVAALTTVMSVTTGFEEVFREKVLGVNAHVIIQRPDFVDYEEVEKIARDIDPQVIGVQPFVFAEMLVTDGKGKISGVAIKGIDPIRAAETLDLDRHMIKGKVQDLARGEIRGAHAGPAPIIIGRELAHKLRVDVGDTIRVVVPVAPSEMENADLRIPSPRTRSYTVTGIFYSGFDEYDKRLMYIGLNEGRTLLGRGNIATGVELKVKDVDQAGRVAAKLRDRLRQLERGFDFEIKDWFELNRPLFRAVRIQKIGMMMFMTLIIVVAAFNIVSALSTMVKQKTREVAILKSMGAESLDIGQMFLLVGAAIGVVGTVLGVALGLLTCWLISVFGYSLDPAVYMIDELPIRVATSGVLLVAGITMVISMLAAVLPAIRAARMHPVEGLRED